MLSRAEAEASSVLSSTIKSLELYIDPIIARNTSRSGFRLKDLMDYDTPVSLYLVLNPASLRRIRPLVRLFLTQMIYALMPEMEFRGGEMKAPYKNRLLLLLDEFPSIGRMNIIQDAIAYFGGWNIKAYLITQDLAQLYDAYGKDNSIIGNCHIQIAYAPNKVETAKYLSEQTGITTVVIKNESESFSGTGPFAKKTINRQQQVQQRPLLTPDECMRLPGAKKDSSLMITEAGDMLVFSAGFPVVYGKQILYFQDPVFSERAKIDAPKQSDVLK
jgi:type IV secretion system protein VirD4